MDPDALRRSAHQSQAGAEREQARVGGHGVDPDYIHQLEHFESFTHPQLYHRVQAMNPGEMHAAAEIWVGIADSLWGAAQGLHNTAQTALSEGLRGHIADAADAAARRFVQDAMDVADIAHTTGARITAAAYGAEAVRKSVPPPMMDAFAEYRREQHRTAIAAMEANYVPIYPPAGSGIPAFSTATAPETIQSTAPDEIDTGTPDSNPVSLFSRSSVLGERTQVPEAPHPAPSANSPTAERYSNPTDPNSATGPAERPASQQIPNPTPTPASMANAETGHRTPDFSTEPTTADTAPATTTQPSTVPAADNPFPLNPSPHADPPQPRTDPLTPRSQPATPTTPDPGRSYPGPVPSEITTRTPFPVSLPSPESPGPTPPPGLYAPGSRPSTSTTEHHSPTWLIRNRQEELLGHPLPTVTPTIGAEILAARNDLALLPDDPQ